MFTGIVETMGDISELKIDSRDNGTTLTISNVPEILSDCRLGDSISVNGTCLTVTWNDKSSFKVGVAPETLRRTNLGSLKSGSRVNLERAVAGHTRMGGHFVQGHVDTIAVIESITPDGNALTFRLRPRDPQVLRYVVEKGYIALDGTSLTVTQVNDNEGWLEVMLISYTQEKIVTATKKVGDDVNVEVDQIGKYVEKAVEGYFLKGISGEPVVLQKIVEKIVDTRLPKAP
ncbi:Riboflavin synthase [Golovinomyces cichoracearum]|uniref:Riboflavin synthase n=1 Tax=Golovinomyces cichoracearum TaxID=62708 RepID=A0A420I5R8_9PEZI|nr:Riboflavin synthase [Golovinomyces cichoracearum]